jgi:hypothetical protein
MKELELERKYGKNWQNLTKEERNEMRRELGFSFDRNRPPPKVEPMVTDVAQCMEIYQKQGGNALDSFCKEVSKNISMIK